MHKKDRVKEVIDLYIKKGKNFFDLTPSYLVELDELKGYSERTLKRGRTEYKNEHLDLLKGKSKGSINLKKKIENYIEKNPGISIEQLQQKYPKADRTLLKECLPHRVTLKAVPSKSRKAIKPTESSGSLRQQVFNHLDTYPDLTLSKLERVFSIANKKTISNYLDQWRKERSTVEKPISTKQRINGYLDQHPQSKLRDLKLAFPDINPSSVGAYHSLWKNNQLSSNGSTRTQLHVVGSMERPKVSGSKEDLSVESARQIIGALNSTVDAQRKMIDLLKEQNSRLEDGQAYSFPDLKGMSSKEIDKFERVMSTFLRGLRKA